MKIGDIDLGPQPILLAPMEDVTDASFRIICKEYGADMVYTEFVPSDGLVRDADKAIAKMHTFPEEAPVGIQIYGHIPEALVEAARMADHADEIAGGRGCNLVDINFGCPVSKIAGRGAGSGMMRDPDKMVQDCGIAALTVHGRTRSQMYKGEADWTLIGKIKENPRMHIPIIGNGDVNSPQKAKECFDRYGVDGIMVGRASFGHPWIFNEIKEYLRTGVLPPPMPVRERVALAKRHYALALELKGERRAVFEMRRHLSCYFKGLQDFRETRARLVTETDPAQVVAILDGIAERWGDTPMPEQTGVYGI